jgi:NADPH-dependent ferric siderophore reductase
MAVYTWGLAHGDVTRGLAYTDGGIDADAEPGTTEITALLEERSAEVNAGWYAAHGSYPSAALATSDETTHKSIAGKIRRRVIVDWLAANQREETESMARHVTEYDALIADLRTQSAHVTGESGSATQLRHNFRDGTAVDPLLNRGLRSSRWRHNPGSFR